MKTNAPKMTDSRKNEIAGIIVSEGKDDVAQLRAVASELLAEVRNCHRLLASQEAHLDGVSKELEKRARRG